MPELPEVETLAAEFRESLPGLIVSKILFTYRPQVFRKHPRELQKKLPGLKIGSVRRRGKFLGIECGPEMILWFHLGMTGRLMWHETFDVSEKHGHFAIEFEKHAKKLVFRDVRKFGKIFWTGKSVDTFPAGLQKMGPEPLEISKEEFAAIYKKRTGRIKSLLLDQRLVAGIGNIYADESLFRAGVGPTKRPHRLSFEKLVKLHAAVQETLREAIAKGGSTINDYISSVGKTGEFQKFHRVYGREGQACPSCGKRIRRIVVAGRSSFFCPQCQQ